MPDASKVFNIIAPAGNGSTTPVETQIPLGLSDVVNCIITWPSGCCGLVGVALLAAESWAFPVQQGTYMAYDDFKYAFGISNQIETGDWSVSIYNADYYAHTIQITLEYDYITLPVQQSPGMAISL